MEDTEKKVRAQLRFKLFSGTTKKFPTEELNTFLETIDNQSFFLNSKEVNVNGDEVIVTVWYLEALKDAEVKKFGKKK